METESELEITYNEADDGFVLFVKDKKFNYSITIKNDEFESDGGFIVDYDDDMDEKYINCSLEHKGKEYNYYVE